MPLPHKKFIKGGTSWLVHQLEHTAGTELSRVFLKGCLLEYSVLKVPRKSRISTRVFVQFQLPEESLFGMPTGFSLYK